MSNNIQKLLGLVLITTAMGLHASSEAAESKFYRCFAQKSFDLCVPSPSKGNNVIGLVKRTSDIQDMSTELKTQLQATSSEAAQPLTPATGAELELAKDNSGYTQTRINGFFPQFMDKNFNKGTNFSGPNCYNTALITSGLLPESDVRYVHDTEFELYLKNFYDRVYKDFRPGDLVVYNATGARDHVAYYLFGDLVFHKKSWNKGHNYRVTAINDAFKEEPFEWKQGGFDALIDTSNHDNFATGDKWFYRKKQNIQQLPALTGREKEQARIIQFLAEKTLENGPKWAIGKTMGLVSENLVESLLGEFRTLGTSQNLAAKLYYTKLESLKSQVFQSIEESHFTSTFASAHIDKINDMICVDYNDYLKQVTAMLLSYFGKNSGEQEVAAVFEKVKAFDRKKCTIPLLKIIKEN